MTTLKELKLSLVEAKKVGTIYHFTTLDNLHKIIHQDKPFDMLSKNGQTISTTRNSNLPINGNNKIGNNFKEHDVRIALDGDKISEHHKIRPVLGLKDNEADVLNHKHNDKYRVKRGSGEAEEAIFKHPFNIKPYIKHIHIIYNRHNSDNVEKHILPELDKHKIPYSHIKGYHLGSFNENYYGDFSSKDDCFLIEVS